MRPQPVRVAIDLETTGLNPEQDAIIEIGAVKFAGERVLDTFETFVSSRAPMPYRIQRLTGIKLEQLRDAPALGAVLPRLRAFLGDAPLVGHNVQFDVTFLRRFGVARHNPLVDTYELASMLLPSLHSYTLASVAGALDVLTDTVHRALSDAQLSREVFLALLQRLDDLDEGTRDMLGGLAAPPDWTPRYFLRSGRPRSESQQSSAFGALLSTTLGSQFAAKLGVDPDVLAFAVARGDNAPPVPSDPESAAADEKPSSTVASVGASIAANLDAGGVLLAEVEQSDEHMLAVMEPAIHWASASAGRVWLCVADSDQIAHVTRRLLPQACARVGLRIEDIGVAEVDERSAYLCLHRWFGLARTPYDTAFSQDTARGLAKVAVWARGTQTGKRSEVTIGGFEMQAWERASAGDEYADSMPGCAYKREGYCFVARAQDHAEAARIIVTTHAALGGWLAGTQSLLPEATRVIVLDAHHLEEGLRRSLGFTLRRQKLQQIFTGLAETQAGGRRAGLLHLVAAHLERAGGKSHERAWFESVGRALACVEQLFAVVARLLPESQGKASDNFSGRDEVPDQRMLRLDSHTRELDSWPMVGRTWAELDQHWETLAKLLRDLAAQVSGAPGDAPITAGALATELRASAYQIARLREQGRGLFHESAGDGVVQWLRLPYPDGNAADRRPQQVRQNRPESPKARGKSDEDQTDEATAQQPADAADTAEEASVEEIVPEIHQARTRVGSLLAPLYAQGRSLVLASSALSVAGEFDHTRGYFGLPESTTTAGYTADRAEQTLLALPEDVPEPNAPHYQHQLDETLVRLATTLNGRLVAIFPSHAALRAAWQGIRRTLERQDILVLAQGQDGSARQIWQTFVSEPRVVLLGAGVFWHGATRESYPPACVVVTRLPFPALSDPLLAARAEQWADAQSQFVVPQAALKVRQALNGLAWSHHQRNAVVLFDRRIQTRGYGQTILATLPRCTQYQEPVAHLSERISEWVGPA
ncbi:MAG TPA: exonuclease domain-containing protein [Ktedonobacterales bacterium]|nr:exonuclease domain-containing protein [Ktedonobacterales bacterium]